jgi:hypothetical protein
MWKWAPGVGEEEEGRKEDSSAMKTTKGVGDL